MEEITITLPVYMGEKYISRALDSVFNQTCDNYKLIVVYDKCTDKTLEILKEYKKKHDFTLVINDTKVGQTPAFNQSHQLVDTKYIAFFMDDDELYPNYIEEVTKCIHDTDADFIRGYFMKGNNLKNPEIDDNTGPCRIYTKKLWEEVGGYLNEWDFYNDTDFWYRVKYHNPQYKIALIRKPLYRYYNVSDNISHTPESHTKRWEEKKLFEAKWKLRESRYFEVKDPEINGSYEDYWFKEIHKVYEKSYNIYSFPQYDDKILEKISTIPNKSVLLTTLQVPTIDINRVFIELVKYGFIFYTEPNYRFNTKDRGVPIEHNGIKYYRICAIKE